MKNKVFLTGILAAALVLGSFFVACDNGSTDSSSSDPEITGITFSSINNGVAAGTPVGTLSATGGTPPFSFTKADGGADNGSFTVASEGTISALVALTIAKPYNVKVKVTDSKGKTMEKDITITPQAAGGAAGKLIVWNLTGGRVTPTLTKAGSTKTANNALGPLDKYEFTNMERGEYTLNTTAGGVGTLTVGLEGTDETRMLRNGSFRTIPKADLQLVDPKPAVIRNASTSDDIIGAIELSKGGNTRLILLDSLLRKGESYTTDLDANTTVSVRLFIRRGSDLFTIQDTAQIVSSNGEIRFSGTTLETLGDGKVTLTNDGATELEEVD